MNTTNNKRYKETEASIQEAFLTLLERKQINDISVKDICNIARISRPSFYSHYDDINDLIIKMEYEKSNHISMILVTHSPLTNNNFINYLSYIKENKNFYIAYFKCKNNIQISQHIMQQYITISQRSITPALRYHMLFFMAGLKAVVLDWINGNCVEPIEQISEILMEQYSLFISI